MGMPPLGDGAESSNCRSMSRGSKSTEARTAFGAATASSMSRNSAVTSSMPAPKSEDPARSGGLGARLLR